MKRVLCVMLANGRQEMVQRAIRSFHSQTYLDRVLLVFDSGAEFLCDIGGKSVYHVMFGSTARDVMSIGLLRNHANGIATPGALDCDLIAHWDSDDWSHPERLTEQVAMLEATGADCVGYRDMLFYDARKPDGCGVAGAWARGQQDSGEAWQFRSPNPAYILGTSMLYTRKIWERFNFQDRAAGEDTLWLMERRIKRETTSSIHKPGGALLTERPRMVAGLHDGNTCSVVKPGAVE